MKKIMPVILLFTLITFLACNGGSAGSTVADKAVTDDTLIVIMSGEAVTLDPQASNDSATSRVTKQIYNTLVTQNENMEIVPQLAESWEITDNGTLLSLKLREGVKFHNGETFTAQDVKFTLERALTSPHVSHIISVIAPNGITIIDDYSLEIRMTDSFAPILSHLAHTAISILNEKAVTEAGDSYGQNPVGTGPYQFVQWVLGDNITLVRNDDYFDENAKIKNLMLRVITENSARAIALETGDAHIAYDLAPNDIARMEASDALKVIRSANFSSAYIGFNASKAPFNDIKVRQAINLALDMDSIIEAVYFGAGSPAKGPIGQKVWGYNTALPGYDYDIQRAKELMIEAGYQNGFTTTIWTNDNQQRIDIAEIAQAQLAEIGITVEIEILEWAAYLERTALGDHEMFILGWVTVTGDPDYGLYATFHSNSFGSAGNRTFYANARVDELLDRARVSGDPTVREEAYKEVQEIIFDEAPWIFTWEGEDLNGAQSYIEGFVNNPSGHHRLDTVYFNK
ncbi:MAG: glutathione ABC transporter substrate-binding protein [Spirochaetales bacterium]